MAPFYQSLCSEAGRPVDSALLSKLQEANETELTRLEEALKDAQENLGDTEVRDALLAKAEYLTKIGDKVRCLLFRVLCGKFLVIETRA